MPILKEYTCSCGHKFDSFAPLCTQCGGIAQRAFRTPVGITTGIVQKSDRLLGSELAARGLSNYTNVHGTPKVTYAKGSGNHSQLGAGWGAESLGRINSQYGSHFNVAPSTGGKSEAEYGQQVGGFKLPTEIVNRPKP